MNDADNLREQFADESYSYPGESDTKAFDDGWDSLDYENWRTSLLISPPESEAIAQQSGSTTLNSNLEKKQ